MTGKQILETVIMEIMLRKKVIAIGLIVISIPLLWFGIAHFEIGGISEQWLAVTVAGSGVFGLFGIGGGIAMLIPKHEPVLKEIKTVNKVMDSVTVDEVITTNSDETGGSVNLMKHEKGLLHKKAKLEVSLAEVKIALDITGERLKAKGWIKRDDVWQIE